MWALKIKVAEAKRPVTVSVSRFSAKLKRQAAWFSRLQGVETTEIVNLKPPKGAGREAQKINF